MKRKSFRLVIVMVIFYYFSCVYAQISQGGKPYSFTHQLSSSIAIKEMPSVDVTTLLHEDSVASKDAPYRFGYSFNVSYNLLNSGTWVKLNDGSKLWRLKIFSQGAYSINLIYDKFWLPEGARFFIYNNDRNMIIGAYTSRNNKPNGKFATELVKGEQIILEYYEPKDVNLPGEINISKVIHAYRNFFNYNNKSGLNKINGFGDAGSCNNNVYCTKAEPWVNEVHSVAKIILGNYAGSGSLINNVKSNYAPYFLTANHVYEDNTDVSTWVFYFNYESSTCDNPATEPMAQTISGATFKANNSASDFALLMLSETPPLSYNVYYNGWSNINTAPSSTVCIHHPSGDIKKISYDDDAAASSTWSGTPANSHWQVVWDDGTTEPGSSGAPLINPDHRVVGQLHGGLASCTNPNGADYFGKFSMSWNYGGSSSAQLKDWLDPDNTGATVLNGMEDGMLAAGELPASATWSGTHNVVGNIIVPYGIALTIESGSVINFSSGTSLIVEGTLYADGATFTSSNSWKGIKLYDSYNSSIQNCTIENFGPGYGSDGIYIEGGWWPLIEHNTIDGIYNGIKLYGTNATIRNNTISFCSNGNGITVEGGSSAIISGNTINNNYYHGISVYSNSTGYVEVYENYLRNNGYITHQYTGIRTYNSAITAYKNKVSNSMFGYFAQHYSDMDFGSDYGPDIFEDNNLADGCSYGLVADDNSTIIAGQYWGGYLADHNSIRNITNYLLSAGNTSTIYAQNDWLGSYPPNEAKLNNDASSYVYWEPYLGSDPLPPLKIGSPSFNENELAMINARSLTKKGSYAEAKQILKDLIDKKSINRAVNPLLRLYYKSKDPEIKTYLENLISKVKDRDASNIYKGALVSIYYEDKEYDKALKLIDEQISSGKEKAIIDKYLVYALGIRDNNSALKILDDINGKLGKATSDELYTLLLPDELNNKSVKQIVISTKQNDIGDKVQYTLSNYPNPFNPTTLIAYNLKERGQIKLIVYDILGKEVAKLVDGIQTEGEHRINFDGSSLPSGIYVYRLTGTNFSISKKMLLIK